MKRASEILAKTEASMRSLIAALVQEGRYDDVAEVTQVARAIGEMRERTGQTRSEGRGSEKPEDRRDRDTRPTPKTAKGRQAHRRRDYPKFEIADGKLVRIGWSKKEKAPYEHRTPRVVFDFVVKAMAAAATTGHGPHAAETIIEGANSHSAEAIPDYQVYSVIGFLRDSGVLTRRGRSGYEVPADIAGRATRAWDEAQRGK